MSYEHYSLGELLRVERNRTRITQQEVRNITGIPTSKLSQYENDKTVPSPKNLKKMLIVYDTKDLMCRLINERYNELTELTPYYQLLYTDISEKEIQRIKNKCIVG